MYWSQSYLIYRFESTLTLVGSACEARTDNFPTAMGATLPANIFYPGIADLKKDLHASDNLVSATVSIFVLGQGVFPMCWSGISEIQGRKTSYIVSLGEERTLWCSNHVLIYVSILQYCIAPDRQCAREQIQ